MYSLRASVLEIFYEDSGPTQGSPFLMLHGWPDEPRGWTRIARELNGKGWRTIIRYLRGTRPTRILSPDIPRVGAGVACLCLKPLGTLGSLFALVLGEWG